MRNFACALLVTTAITTALPTIACAQQYKVDPVHSSVVFRVKHLGVSYCYGRFDKTSGTFQLDEQNPSASAIDVVVESGSVDTSNTQRDTHLRNPDFFDAAKFPTIRFVSTKVSRQGTGPYVVAGDLTLHGVTKPVTLEIEATGSGKGMMGETRSGLETVFNINRTDFGMDKMVGPVADEVRLMVSVEGIRQ
ncbi:MAG TPA: YceI family protein [Pirellulales bacterium]|jgi:polyisoprenoid-binding protein YceI